MIPGASAFTAKGLREYLSELDRVADDASMYDDILQHESGTFLVMELIKRQDYIRRLYKTIDPTHDASSILLSSLQAYERENDEWLSRLSQPRERLKAVEEEKGSILKMLEHRDKARNEGERMIPVGYKRVNKEKES